MVEERSLKVLSNDTTFFNKVSNTLTKLLMPTKIGINGMMINIKRSSAIKTFEQYKENEASRKTIIANGGILENEIIDDIGLSVSGIIQRYWITL